MDRIDRADPLLLLGGLAGAALLLTGMLLLLSAKPPMPALDDTRATVAEATAAPAVANDAGVRVPEPVAPARRASPRTVAPWPRVLASCGSPWVAWPSSPVGGIQEVLLWHPCPWDSSPISA